MISRVCSSTPENGRVENIIDISRLHVEQKNKHKEAVLNEIMYDKKENRIYIISKFWQTIQEIKTMNDDKYTEINTDYKAEKFDDEILLYSKKGEMAVYLNDAAHAVWLLCKEGMTVSQMVAYLEEAYPDQKEQIRGDVISALEMLLENNVIELVDV